MTPKPGSHASVLAACMVVTGSVLCAADCDEESAFSLSTEIVPIEPIQIRPHGITLVDLDGDGDLDVATADGPFGYSVFLNDGGGSFVVHRRVDSGSNSLLNTITSGDFDGDGVHSSWGHIQPAPGSRIGIPGPFAACPSIGAYDPASGRYRVQWTGPCDEKSGQTEF